MCVCAFSIKSGVEVRWSGRKNPSPRITDRPTGAAVDYNGRACTNWSGAELSGKSAEENDGKEKASMDACLNDTKDVTVTDKLTAYRMTLLVLEDSTTLSSDDSIPCRSLLMSHSVDAPSSTPASSLVIEVDSSTSKDVMTTDANTLSSNDSGLLTTTRLSWPDSMLESVSTINGSSGSKLYGAARKNIGIENLISLESKSPSVASTILCGESQLLTVEDEAWNSERLADETSDRVNGVQALPAATTTCSSSSSSVQSSPCSVVSSDDKSQSFTVEHSVSATDTDHGQHPADGTADKVHGHGTTVTNFEGGSVVTSEGKCCATITSDDDVQRQSSTTEHLIFTADGTMRKVDDDSWRQNICNTNTAKLTDGKLKEEVSIKSQRDCLGVSWPRGPTPLSSSSFGSCGSKMKGLRIPSATATVSLTDNSRGSSTTAVTLHNGGPCVDLPVIAGVTARTVGDSSTSSVLPATLLPRPFVARSCYRSVRPLLPRTFTVSATQSNSDGSEYIAASRNGLPPPVSSIRESTMKNTCKCALCVWHTAFCLLTGLMFDFMLI